MFRLGNIFKVFTLGRRVEGDGEIRVEDGWLVAELRSGAKLVAPPVDINAYEDLFLSFVMAVDRGSSGRLYWACDKLNGLHHLDFPLIPDGEPHVYNVPLSVREWQGKVIYLAMSRVSKRWNRPIANWPAALNYFSITFEGRLPD